MIYTLYNIIYLSDQQNIDHTGLISSTLVLWFVKKKYELQELRLKTILYHYLKLN